MLKKILIVLFIFSIGLSAHAQQDQNVESVVVRKKKHSPKKAAILSAIIPGAGQVYNKKYWKVPLVYGAIGTSFVLSQRYRNEYQKYRDIYRLEADDDSTTVSELHSKLERNLITLTGIKDTRDTYRSWMELSYIFTGLFYVLQVVDASVDAHFMDFDVSDDLTLHVEPKMLSIHGSRDMATGLGLRLTLN